jgi:hypothetical protein
MASESLPASGEHKRFRSSNFVNTGNNSEIPADVGQLGRFLNFSSAELKAESVPARPFFELMPNGINAESLPLPRNQAGMEQKRRF